MPLKELTYSGLCFNRVVSGYHLRRKRWLQPAKDDRGTCKKSFRIALLPLNDWLNCRSNQLRYSSQPGHT
jgi:ribosomal protein L20